MTEQQAANQFVDVIIQALSERVLSMIRDDIAQMIADSKPTVNADEVERLEEFVRGTVKDYLQYESLNIQADDVNGLEGFVEREIESYERNNKSDKIDADDIEGLEKYISDVINQGNFNISFDT